MIYAKPYWHFQEVYKDFEHNQIKKYVDCPILGGKRPSKFKICLPKQLQDINMWLEGMQETKWPAILISWVPRREQKQESTK